MTRRRVAALGGGGLLLVLVVGYVVLHFVAGDQVPRGTTVAGVEIGGLSAEEARESLEEGLSGRADEPLRVRVEDRSDQVTPSAAGLQVDHAETVADADGRSSWSPVRLWRHLAGGGAVDPVISSDEAALTAALDRLGKGLGAEARNGRWTFQGAKAVPVAPVVGRALDADHAEDALTEAYIDSLAGDSADATLQLVDVAPEIDADDMEQAKREIVDPALSGRVVLAFGGSRVPLPPAAYLPALRLQPRDGELVADLHPDKAQALLDRVTAKRGEPVDATFRIVRGKPRVVPARPGVTYDAAEARAALLQVITAPRGQRRAEIEAEVDEPDFTTEEAHALGVKELVSEFPTHFPHADYRNTNIGRAAELVDGTVLEPGETFSLNGIVGERTAENGFTEGYVINNGILKKELGGGVSQLATTTFNAMFFAGLEDVEHKPHSFFIDRYPAGREATVAWPTLDLKFRNNSKYGVLVQAVLEPSSWSSQGTVTVRMYSTKTWDIKARESERYDYTSPGVRTFTTPDCEEHTGSSGFTIDVWRDFRRPGSDEVVKTEKFHTVYKPADTVVCEDPPPPPAPPAPTDTPDAE